VEILATTALAAMLVAATAVLPVSARELQPSPRQRLNRSACRWSALGASPQCSKGDCRRQAARVRLVMVARKGKIVYRTPSASKIRARKRHEARFDLPHLSMTKPLVSVAAICWSKMASSSSPIPISKFLPAFKDMQVSVAPLG